MPEIVYPVEERGKRRQKLHYVPDYNDPELHSLAVPPEGLYDELERDVLERAVDDLVLDDGAVEFRDLLQVLHRVLVQEAVLVEEAVEHAGVDLLVFLHFRGTETLHDIDQLANLGIDLGGLG